MSKLSLFKFVGELHPKDQIPSSNSSYNVNRAEGSMTISISESIISVEFVARFDSFDDLYAEITEFIQSFLAVQALKTWFPVQLVFTEWLETPIEPIGSDGISHQVRGRILQDTSEKKQLPTDALTFELARGISWAEDLDTNPFLRRAVLDFNYALQHPINDIPIYLFRAIDSAQVYFGGENELLKALNVEGQVKKVKKLANEGQSGAHVRHAAKTSSIRHLSNKEIIEVIEATSEILEAFQMYVSRKRLSNSGN